MDPGNDEVPYDCEVDIMELVSMYEVMKALGLGPNGALVFCMEYIEANLDWVLQKVRNLKGKYLLFDFPGQIELYVYHDSCRNIMDKIRNTWEINICAINLVDSIHTKLASDFIGACTLALSTMLHLELPHLNFLSKFDIIKRNEMNNESLPHDITDVYLSLENLEHLLPDIDEEIGALKGHRDLAKDMVRMIQQTSLLRFNPISVFSSKLLQHAVNLADRAVGYMSENDYRKVMHDRGLTGDWEKLAKERYDEMGEKDREKMFGKLKKDDGHENNN
eukprot:CAMPEP_0167760396 /NCGR_PEP_ID=MMETSP0110_2-20121227/11565_1 /TAXON_ID=629695 /ORGANISM="Gymnochlora sp., Strain CCMP2014" /LENGTH=276 /DNA_ID=CAMNT_0007646907 /DNA_START=404 /DNA_END=1232 /DNA_ORIENTATION=+